MDESQSQLFLFSVCMNSRPFGISVSNCLQWKADRTQRLPDGFTLDLEDKPKKCSYQSLNYHRNGQMFMSVSFKVDFWLF